MKVLKMIVIVPFVIVFVAFRVKCFAFDPSLIFTKSNFYPYNFCMYIGEICIYGYFRVSCPSYGSKYTEKVINMKLVKHCTSTNQVKSNYRKSCETKCFWLQTCCEGFFFRDRFSLLQFTCWDILRLLYTTKVRFYRISSDDLSK